MGGGVGKCLGSAHPRTQATEVHTVGAVDAHGMCRSCTRDVVRSSFYIVFKTDLGVSGILNATDVYSRLLGVHLISFRLVFELFKKGEIAHVWQ